MKSLMFFATILGWFCFTQASTLIVDDQLTGRYWKEGQVFAKTNSKAVGGGHFQSSPLMSGGEFRVNGLTYAPVKILESGVYEVSASWPEVQDASSKTRYLLTIRNQKAGKVFNADQKKSSNGFKSLGFIEVLKDAEINVSINTVEKGKWAVIDAVKFELVKPDTIVRKEAGENGAFTINCNTDEILQIIKGVYGNAGASCEFEGSTISLPPQGGTFFVNNGLCGDPYWGTAKTAYVLYRCKN